MNRQGANHGQKKKMKIQSHEQEKTKFVWFADIPVKNVLNETIFIRISQK